MNTLTRTHSGRTVVVTRTRADELEVGDTVLGNTGRTVVVTRTAPAGVGRMFVTFGEWRQNVRAAATYRVVA